MKKTAMIGILALFVVIAISTAAAADSEFYLVPQDSSVAAYGDTIEVGLWLNGTVPVASGAVAIDYTYCCADIIEYSPKVTFFEDHSGMDWNGQLRVLFAHWGAVGLENQPAGRYHLGNFTIQCCNETSDCMTDLLLVDCELYESVWGGPSAIPFETADGTFTCGGAQCEPHIEVNKTVWDGTTWVETIDEAEIGEIYRFRCEVHNNGDFDLINILFNDTMSDSLEYVNNATVDGILQEPDDIDNRNNKTWLTWYFTEPLVPSGTIVIEFDAKSIACGNDSNHLKASAVCEEPEEVVVDEDDAWINVPDGTDCGTDYYDDPVGYCNGDEVWEHQLFHDFYCEAGNCTDHTSWVNDTLVANCSESDGWHETGNTEWITDLENVCKEKEQKEEEYRDYTCSDGACEYSITETRWTDTGEERNKQDGTDCGTDYYDDPVGYCNGDEVWEHQLFHDFYCEAGNCTDHTSWVNDTLVANCSESDGWHETGNTEWITDLENVCKEKEQKEEEYRDYTCSDGACEYSITETRWTDTGEERNKQDGTDCGTDYYDDPVGYCNGDEVWEHQLFHDFYCEAGNCTDHTSWVNDTLVANCSESDGWHETGNTEWITDLENVCKEKEQKEEEYRDYTCSDGACEYSITETRWTDTGEERNKQDGTDCGTDYYDDPVGYCNGDEVWEHQLFHDFYCEAGNCTDHTSWVNDTLVANCSESDGWHETGNTEWITDLENVCKEKEQKEEEYRDYTCSDGACEYSITETRWTDTGEERNKQDGTDCGTDYYDDPVGYCNGDEVWEHQLFHDFYCEAGNCTDHTSWVNDTLVANCSESDGWHETGNTEWITDLENVCKEKEQKEEEYRDYTCSDGACEYSITETRWTDTGEERNKQDGTDCGTDYYDDPVGYCNGDEVWEHQLFHDFYCEAGNCTDHTSWVNDTLVANCSESDGWHETGNTEWITDLENVCKEKEQKEEEYRDYTCSDGACEYSITETRWTDTGEERNKQDGTVCGHSDWETDPSSPCQERRQIHKCDSGECTPSGKYEYRTKPIPDLMITKKSEEWVSGNTYTVTYTVSNIGNASAIASTTSLYVDGVHVANNSVGALSAGENHTATFTDVITMSDNNDTIVVCADNTNNVSECNETNNCLENVLESHGMPDLVITYKSEEWINQAERTYNITYTVCNNGTATAGKSNTSIAIDAAKVMEDAVDALAAGQCYTNTVGPFTMSDDRDLIEVCADNPNEIEESNETNNCLENVFEYQGPSYQPDLTVKTNVTFGEDGNIIVNYTVTNRGSSKAGNSTTCLYVDNTKLQAPSDLSVKCEPKPTQSMFCPGLGIGESHTGTFDSVECPCNKILTVKVCADCKYEVEESNEDNNCEQKRVECPECKKPDLIVTKNKVEENNGIFIVSYTVTNIGCGTAGESTTCMSVEKAPYTPSNLAAQCEPDDPWHQSQSCPELKPGKSHNGKFKFEECPCGEKLNVTVCADYNEAVKESNETNNCLATELECPPCGPTASYGKKVQSRRNVLYARGALGEPDDRGALMYRNSKIAIKLEDTIPDCERVSVGVRRVAGQAPKFTVEISSDGKSWTKIGTETCTSFGWALYDFNANGEDVKYIRITKPGSSSRRWWQQLKLMGLDAVYAEGKPN